MQWNTKISILKIFGVETLGYQRDISKYDSDGLFSEYVVLSQMCIAI